MPCDVQAAVASPVSAREAVQCESLNQSDGICVAGQAPPRRIVDRQREIRISGESYRLRAEVEVMNAYSAHADEPELLKFVGHLDRKRRRRIFLVHGDPARQLALFEALRADGHRAAHGPARGETVEL